MKGENRQICLDAKMFWVKTQLHKQTNHEIYLESGTVFLSTKTLILSITHSSSISFHMEYKEWGISDFLIGRKQYYLLTNI